MLRFAGGCSWPGMPVRGAARHQSIGAPGCCAGTTFVPAPPDLKGRCAGCRLAAVLGQERPPVDGRSGASWLQSPTHRTADARRRIGLRRISQVIDLCLSIGSHPHVRCSGRAGQDRPGSGPSSKGHLGRRAREAGGGRVAQGFTRRRGALRLRQLARCCGLDAAGHSFGHVPPPGRRVEAAGGRTSRTPGRRVCPRSARWRVPAGRPTARRCHRRRPRRRAIRRCRR